MTSREAWREAMLDAWAVIAPTECSGCGAWDRALCRECRSELVPRVHSSTRESSLGTLDVWSALSYTGVAQRVIVAYADGGRTDAAPVLGRLLRAAVAAATEDGMDRGIAPARGGDGRLYLAAIPSSRRAMRTRGFRPVELLLRHAGLSASAVLRQRPHIRDQVGLGRSARAENKRDSMTARHRLDGRRFVLVDDILTTGATLLEARRAIRAAGGDVVGCATLAETPRHSFRSVPIQETLQQKL